MRNTFFYFFFLFIAFQRVFAISIGSNTAVSRQPRVAFPAVDSNNTLLGFGEFINGFEMEIGATCTYNDLFPLAGEISLGSGVLTLQKDVVFHNSTKIYRGGRIRGQNHSFSFQECPSYYMFSAILDHIADFRYITVGSVPTYSVTGSWSLNDTYLAVGAYGLITPELTLFTFDGSSLTVTSNGTVNVGVTVNEVRWHPTSYYLAVCSDSLIGNELKIYERRIYNGTLVNIAGAEIGYNAMCCAWHKDGNYLVVGTQNPTAQLQLYSFSGSSLTLEQSLYLSPLAVLDSDVIRWSPDGHYVVVGTQALIGGPELRLFYFDGSTLTYTANAEIGYEVPTLDWSPSGTFILVGTYGAATNNLRVFSHNVWNGTLTENTTAAVPLTVGVNGIRWDGNGNSFILTTINGASSQLQLYTFNKSTLTSFLSDTYNLGSQGGGTFFSRNGLYLEVGIYAPSNNTFVFNVSTGLQTDPFYFKDTAIVVNGMTILTVPWFIDGTCMMDVCGYGLVCMFGGALIIRPGATLTIKNAFIGAQTSRQLYCMTDNGSLILENCDWVLGNDYTFSKGALQFIGDVLFTGSCKFTYAATRTSTIASHCRVLFDVGTTFSYSPPVAKRNLLYMTDKSSDFYFADASLYATRTGLTLSNGRLFIDNKVTFSSSGRNLAEGIIFDSTLDVNVLGSAIFDIYGPAKFL